MQRPVDLQLSGHTHGGQIAGMSHIVKKMNRGFVSGWYKVNDMPLYVSSGAGLWGGFPIRLGVPSEIARIVLRSV
jgi:predicted MPP superfamily phosphohydrolase